MKKSLTQKELADARTDFSRFQEKVEKETQIKKNELTIDAIDTLILNSLWDEDLPMTAHIKNETYFIVILRSGEDFAKLERRFRSTEYVLTMRKSGKQSRVVFNPESDPLITTPDMIINGIYRMVSHIFKTATS